MPAAMHAARSRTQEGAHLAHHVMIIGIVLHGTRLALHVHETHAHPGAGRPFARARARAARARR